MPTYEVQIHDPGFTRARRLRIPAPDAARARRRGARRALAIERPALGETLTGEEFRKLAAPVAEAATAVQVG